MTPGSISGIVHCICVLGMRVDTSLVCISLTIMSFAVTSLITKGLASNPCVVVIDNPIMRITCR